MREILTINPVRRKKRKTKKKVAVKAKTTKRKRTVRKAVSKNPSTKKRSTTMAKQKKKAVRRKLRRNPSRKRRATTYARSTLAGMNVKKALKNVPPSLVGMMAAKWASKLFKAGSTETDPESWTWRSYLQGGLGALAGGFLMQMVKPGWGQKTLEGGINLILYKVVQNELVAGNAWATNQFGQENDYVPDEYMEGLGAGEYIPGEVYPGTDGSPYLLGEDNQWYPVDDSYRLPEADMSDDLVPVSRLGGLGDDLVPVGPLGEDKWGRALLSDDYTEAFF